MVFIKKILIDLDGVLNEYNKFDENSIPKIKDGVNKNVGQVCPTDKIYNLIKILLKIK